MSVTDQRTYFKQGKIREEIEKNKKKRDDAPRAILFEDVDVPVPTFSQKYSNSPNTFENHA